MNRIPLVLVAVVCGYNIRCIAAGAYYLIPATVVLAVILTWLVLRPTKKISVTRILKENRKLVQDETYSPAHSITKTPEWNQPS